MRTIFVYLNFYRQKDPVIWYNGDEGHYVILAESLASFRSLDVQNAYKDYDLQLKTGVAAVPDPMFYLRPDGHTVESNKHLYSIHSLGVPLLLNFFNLIPGDLLYKNKVRLFLILLTSFLPFVFYFSMMAITKDFWISLTTAVLLPIGYPYILASGQVYPDLPTGVLLVTSFYCLLEVLNGRFHFGKVLLIIFSLCFIPYLHQKNAIASACLGMGLLLAISRDSDLPHKKKVFYTVFTLVCVAIAGAALIRLNLTMYNSPTGYHRFGIIIPWSGVAVQYFGIHFDQAQGIFVQQPFLLLGLLGLPFMLIFQPTFTLLWFLTYFSISFLNASHHCAYGCASAAGRFQWSIIPLFIFPMACFLRAKLVHQTFRFFIGSCLLLHSLWQYYLFHNPAGYGHYPPSIFLNWTPDLAQRNSFFPVEYRTYLPSFYDYWQSMNSGVNVFSPPYS